MTVTVGLLLQSVLNLAHSRCCSPMPAFRSLLPTCLAYLGHCPHFLLERWLLAHDPPGHLLLEGLEGIYLFVSKITQKPKSGFGCDFVGRLAFGQGPID